jgi:hypothetical protein
MMHVLAQGGGGGGGLFNANNIRLVVVVGFVLFSLLGGVIKKIGEKNAKRAAELARERRREEMLRTGRDETGAFVDVTRASVLDAPPTASPTPPTSDDARAKLQQLAERRRRELAEMMKRSATAGSGSKPVPTSQPRSAPQAARPPQPRQSPQPRQQPQPRQTFPQQQSRRPSEQDSRRQREQQEKADRKAAAGARRGPQVSGGTSATEQPAPPTPGSTPMHAAYELPIARTGATQTNVQQATSSKVGAAIARAGGVGGASEWRKAIVLSELLRPPVSLRDPSEGSM